MVNTLLEHYLINFLYTTSYLATCVIDRELCENTLEETFFVYSLVKGEKQNFELVYETTLYEIFIYHLFS